MQKMWVKILKDGPNEIFSQISSKTCPEAITSPSNKLLMQPRMLFWQSKHMFDINTSRFCIDMMPCYSFIILQAGYRCKVQSLALAARIMFLHTSTSRCNVSITEQFGNSSVENAASPRQSCSLFIEMEWQGRNYHFCW